MSTARDRHRDHTYSSSRDRRSLAQRMQDIDAAALQLATTPLLLELYRRDDDSSDAALEVLHARALRGDTAATEVLNDDDHNRYETEEHNNG